MHMHWKLKAHALAVLSRIPGGRSAYHALQKQLGTNRLNLTESLGRTAELFGMIRAAGLDLEDKTVVEVGTGWRPLVPMFLYLAGARRIHTYDVNPWLDLAYVREASAAVGARLADVADRLDLDEAAVRERFAAARCQQNDLRAVLQAMRIDYHCPGDAGATGLPAQSVDAVVSTNVLEHVYPHDLRRIHLESKRILAPGGVAAHRVDVSDHFVAVDQGITAGNFLQFSPAAWNWYGGSGLSYHNRLRCSDQVRLMEEAGLHVAENRTRVHEPTLCAIQDGTLPVDAAFAGYADEDLAGSFLWMTGLAEPVASACH